MSNIDDITVSLAEASEEDEQESPPVSMDPVENHAPKLAKLDNGMAVSQESLKKDHRDMNRSFTEEPAHIPEPAAHINGHTEGADVVSPLPPPMNPSELPSPRKESRDSWNSSNLSTSPRPSFSNVAPPTGTLADLKRQRAMQLQNQLQNSRLGPLPVTEGQTTNGNYKNTPNANVVPPSERNGHSPSMADSRVNSQDYYTTVPMGGDPPKRRYTATSPSEIVGGDDGKQRCCVIL